MNTFKCLNCGYENNNKNIKCESCGTELKYGVQNANFFNKDYSQKNTKIIDLGSKKVKRVTNVILIILLAPWFLIGLAFIGFSIYFNISNNNKSKNYLETEGKLVSYDNCQYNNNEKELCDAVYEYKVDNITYKGYSDLLSSRSGFEQTTIVKYNPNNPNEYVISSRGDYWLLITGIIMFTIALVVFLSIKSAIKKISNMVNNSRNID